MSGPAKVIVVAGAQGNLGKLVCQAFIPSDFSADFTKLPEGSHRNFDLRRRFHAVGREHIERSASAIEVTSIFQGGFTELLGSGWVLFDYKKQRVNYFGSADSPMEFTTWQNTAEVTAAVALDEAPTPRYLYRAGQRLTPREAQAIAKRAVANPDMVTHLERGAPRKTSWRAPRSLGRTPAHAVHPGQIHGL